MESVSLGWNCRGRVEVEGWDLAVGPERERRPSVPASARRRADGPMADRRCRARQAWRRAGPGLCAPFHGQALPPLDDAPRTGPCRLCRRHRLCAGVAGRRHDQAGRTYSLHISRAASGTGSRTQGARPPARMFGGGSPPLASAFLGGQAPPRRPNPDFLKLCSPARQRGRKPGPATTELTARGPRWRLSRPCPSGLRSWSAPQWSRRRQTARSPRPPSALGGEGWREWGEPRGARSGAAKLRCGWRPAAAAMASGRRGGAGWREARQLRQGPTPGPPSPYICR
jgi:hypothetical protein